MKHTILKIHRAVKIFASTDFVVLLSLTLLWQITLLVIGLVAQIIIPRAPEAAVATPYFVGWPQHTYGWDSGWFGAVIENGYASSPYLPSFYPLFPYLVEFTRLLFLNSVSFVAAGFIVNTIASWLALVALYRIAKHLFPGKPKIHWLSIGLFLLAPAAFFLHLFYSEAVFCALGFWAYYFALRRNWFGVGLMLAPLTATRITSVLFVALCAFEFCRAYEWKVRKLVNRRILWFGLAPLGFITYAIILEYTRQSYTAMLHSYGLWSYHIFNPNIFETVWRIGKEAGVLLVELISGKPELLNGPTFVNTLLPFVSLVVLLVTSLILLFKVGDWGIPLGLFGILTFVMLTLNSNIVSVHRYLLPCLSVYLACAWLVSKYRLALPIVVFGAFITTCVQILLYSTFVRGFFAG